MTDVTSTCRTCGEPFDGSSPHCASCAEYWKELNAIDGIVPLQDLLIRWYGPNWRTALAESIKAHQHAPSRGQSE